MAKGSGNTRGVAYFNTLQKAANEIARQMEMSLLSEAANEVGRRIDIIDANGGHGSRESQGPPVSIGSLPKNIVNFYQENHYPLESTQMVMTSKQLQHGRREDKIANGLLVSKEEMKNFILHKNNAGQFYDSKKKDLIFVMGNAKFVMTPNYDLKLKNGKTKVVNYITATRIEGNISDHVASYKKIKDEKQ
jgi:hypothetical protein